MSLKSFVTGFHDLYQRYESEWRLAYNSYLGGSDYKNARYLKAYAVDFDQPNQSIKTYDVASDGRITSEYHSTLKPVGTLAQADAGNDVLDGSFYFEKLENTPVFPYVRLYVNEYNSLLFRNPPYRYVGEDDSLVRDLSEMFTQDVDGEGNSINEFMSQVDILSTVFGVCWVSCVKPQDSDLPQWRIHTPLEVKNWRYQYRSDGQLELTDLVIEVGRDASTRIFRYYTKEAIHTIWVPEGQSMPEILAEDIQEIEGMYVSTSPNELGYIPVVPVYQSFKLYNGIGSTPIHDIAQIQRSIYANNAEIYAAITYGAHPVLVVDQATANLNAGKIGAEPGTIVTVPETLPGQAKNFTYEFAAPPLESITEIRTLIEQMIQRMNEIAMVNGSDLIRQSTSGVQLEQANEKLEAFVRKKATNMENAEVKLWRIWLDWMDQPFPDEFRVSYSRNYNRRSISQEVAELQGILDIYARYESMFAAPGAVNGEVMTSEGMDGEMNEMDDSENEVEDNNNTDIHEIREALKEKFKSILMSSYTENGQ